MERKLATIRRVSALQPIEGADKIEVATVDSWNVVVQKGEFSVGGLCIYLEIDSWVPHDLAPFLSKGKEPRTYMGIKGERLRTIKLRGQLSQGLLLKTTAGLDKEGEDVSEKLGVIKYDPEGSAIVVPTDKSLFSTLMKYKLFRNTVGNRILELLKDKKGAFPTHLIPKTDEERVQNLTNEYKKWNDFNWESNYPWSMTEKLDGQSATYYIETEKHWLFKKRRFGVCSRNLKLNKPDTSNHWDIARRYELERILKSIQTDCAIQGEIIGPKIQGNPYSRSSNEFYVFNVIHLKDKRKLTNEEVKRFCFVHNLQMVPLIASATQLPPSVDDLLKIADGNSRIKTDVKREGLVIRHNTRSLSFKAISNEYLLKEEK